MGELSARRFFALADIRHNDKFMYLVKFLAYNLGSEVSYDNLARETGLNKTTVADYLQLLEQCFIIKICPSFSRNLSNELKKGKKVYFFDNGIRNAIIGVSARCPQDEGTMLALYGKTSSLWNASSCTASAMTS